MQQVTQPNKTFIRVTNAHLSQWGQALHNMLNSEGASAEERDKANREARLAGLKCVWSLLAEGETFSEAEEQNTDQKLQDTVQAALRAPNNQADKTLIKIIKQVPRHRPAIRSKRSGGHLHYLRLPEHGPTLLVGAWDGNVAGGGAVPCHPGDVQHKVGTCSGWSTMWFPVSPQRLPTTGRPHRRYPLDLARAPLPRFRSLRRHGRSLYKILPPVDPESKDAAR